MRVKRTCSLPSCGDPRQAKGLCGKHYMRQYRRGTTDPRPTVEQRFWPKVVPEGDCWIWQGRTTADGYGRFGKNHRAHRLAYELLVGPIPEGLELDHLCRVKRCCNPDHLEPVTHEENLARAHVPMASETHCARGHRLDEANTKLCRSRRNPDKVWRQCRACTLLKQRERRLRLTT